MAIPIRDNHWRQIPHPLRQYYIISWARNTKLSLSLPMDAMHFLWSKKKTRANRSNEAINIRICKKQCTSRQDYQSRINDLIGFVSWILLDYDIRSQTILREREVFIFFVHASLVCHLCASSSSILKWDGAWAVLCL